MHVNDQNIEPYASSRPRYVQCTPLAASIHQQVLMMSCEPPNTHSFCVDEMRRFVIVPTYMSLSTAPTGTMDAFRESGQVNTSQVDVPPASACE